MPSPGFAETNVFLAVLEQKSFSKAAKLLGLSPARVSELVRQMEDSLGVRLIERTLSPLVSMPELGRENVSRAT
jgi:DNA-binding transcriptional LysR family regulator